MWIRSLLLHVGQLGFQLGNILDDFQFVTICQCNIVSRDCYEDKIERNPLLYIQKLHTTQYTHCFIRRNFNQISLYLSLCSKDEQVLIHGELSFFFLSVVMRLHEKCPIPQSLTKLNAKLIHEMTFVNSLLNFGIISFALPANKLGQFILTSGSNFISAPQNP